MFKRRISSAIITLLAVAALFYFYNKYRVAPDLDVEHLDLKNLDGSTFNSSNLRGKTVLVNYWATWCGQCLQEMPSIEAAYNQTDHEKVVFLMVTDDSPEKIRNYLSTHNYPMQFVYLEKRLQEVGINTLPTTYIFDDEGSELFNHVGVLDWCDPGIVGLLKK
jgi:thiol-disulfide isomerase/thioredoxin